MKSTSMARIAACLTCLGSSPSLTADDAALQAALAKVNAQCPQSYPDTVTPLPDPAHIASLPTAELMVMLESWNPALRSEVAKELGKRGETGIPDLRKGVLSENWMVRAGCAQALASFCANTLADWKKQVPAATDMATAQQELKKRFAGVERDFIQLAADPRLEVRVSAMAGLNALAPQSPAAVMAVLKLTADEDNYLAQDAMISLDKNFQIASLQQADVVAAFKAALKSPLPRGRGHIIRSILRMDAAAQRIFVPDLLAHLEWKPMRDTMFGGGGQHDALAILTKLKVKEVVALLPALMTKPMRGQNLFLPSLDSAKAFGKDARPILPQLKTMLQDLEKNGAAAADVAALKATITELEQL